MLIKEHLVVNKKIPINFGLKQALAFPLPENGTGGVPKHILVVIQLVIYNITLTVFCVKKLLVTLKSLLTPYKNNP